LTVGAAAGGWGAAAAGLVAGAGAAGALGAGLATGALGASGLGAAGAVAAGAAVGAAGLAAGAPLPPWALAAETMASVTLLKLLLISEKPSWFRSAIISLGARFSCLASSCTRIPFIYLHHLARAGRDRDPDRKLERPPPHPPLSA
jgi:hypothetical protein